MGNVIDFPRPTFGRRQTPPVDIWKGWDGILWDDFIRRRQPDPNVPPDNGFNLCGYEMPEPVLELIFSKLPGNELLKLNYVCRVWKDLLTRKSFWKQCYAQNALSWDNSPVPLRVREKPEGWMVLYEHLRHKVFSKNYIRNPSGKHRFEDWTIFKNGGDRWIIEEEPVGCDPLPPPTEEQSTDPGEPDRSCFVSSFQWCSKYYVVDLWQQGLTPVVMRICLPLEIRCSQMYSARFDCGGVFRWELRILDSDEKIIKDYKAIFELPPGNTWETAKYSFKFKTSQREYVDQVRYLVFIHEGRDSQFWKGHYGMKFARSCVSVRCLESDPESEIEVDNDTAQDDSSSENGHEF